jgi:hypothetical protein
VEVTETPTPQVEEQDMATPVEREMNALDRCDRCSAQAYVRTRHPLGRHTTDEAASGELQWCNHCYNRRRGILEPFMVHDERHKLTAPLASSY